MSRVKNLNRNNVVRATGIAASSGIGMGTALACAISWSVNKSILWAMLRVFSWLYVIYYAITS